MVTRGRDGVAEFIIGPPEGQTRWHPMMGFAKSSTHLPTQPIHGLGVSKTTR